MRQPDEDERLWSMLAHGGAIFVPVIGPAVIWFIKREDSEYIAYHAAQALAFSATAYVVTILVGIVTCGAGTVIFPFFWLAHAYVALKAREGSRRGYGLFDSFGRDGTLGFPKT